MMRGQNDKSITDRIFTESCDYLEAFSILLDNRIQLIIDKVKSESKKGSTKDLTRPIVRVLTYRQNESSTIILTIKWGAPSQLSPTQYCLMRSSGQMTIGKTHSTLVPQCESIDL